ncbi:protein of unknown function DUF329 [Candidatus Magnetoovum chiemensis]|nr:protein of unknown function DUF329 [Candidatus Magnetoovum chiemensis]
MKCLKCGKDTKYENNPFRPFCSKRCKISDLAAWANEDYVIKGVQSEDEQKQY